MSQDITIGKADLRITTLARDDLSWYFVWSLWRGGLNTSNAANELKEAALLAMSQSLWMAQTRGSRDQNTHIGDPASSSGFRA